MCLISTTLTAQKDVPIPINIITSDAIKGSGKWEASLNSLIPTGKGADAYSFGISLGAKYHLVNEPVKVYTSDMPAAELERLEVIKGGMGPVVGANALSGLVVMVSPKENESSLPKFKALEERRWNLDVGVGYDLMFGKEETYGNMSYKNDALSLIYAYLGLVYRPCERADLELNVGPGTAIFKNGSEFGVRFGANISYDLKKTAKHYAGYWNSSNKLHVNTALTVGFSYNKYNEVDAFTNIYAGLDFKF
jgi:hypothetical protein